MDTPVALANIPVQFRFLAKRGLFQIPFLGTHLSRAGHIPVPREDPRAAVKVMQQAAEVIQAKKISLLIFPEGGRSHDGQMRPFKEGGLYIAIRAGVPRRSRTRPSGVGGVFSSEYHTWASGSPPRMRSWAGRGAPVSSV